MMARCFGTSGVLPCTVVFFTLALPHGEFTPDLAIPGSDRHGEISFFHRDGIELRRPDSGELVNLNGSPRIHRESDYQRFWTDVAPELTEWARDERLAINPAYVAALLAKESGFDPVATSWTPANGYPQLTHVADADMLQIVRDAPRWRWMLDELESFPRHPLVHREDARKLVTDSLVAIGEIDARNEYFFDPVRSTRGAVFWLRLLADIWTGDEYPGRYGAFAREHLNRGKPLTERQIFELVTVSYNRGYTYVEDLIVAHGPRWVEHVNEEAADHLERIRFYTALFQGG